MPRVKVFRRVVITGLGAITPVGKTARESWENLRNGQSGIGPITLFDASTYQSRLAGEVKDFDPQQYMDRKDARHADRFVQFAVAATDEAVANAKLDIGKENTDRIGVVIGSGIGGFGTMQQQHAIHVQRGHGRVSPFVIPMLIINMASGVVSMRLGVRGPNSAIVTACASGANAIGDGYKIIQRGDAEVMLAGGAEATVTTFGYAGFCNMGALSTRNEAGPAASCPFDKRRDGFVMGEGAGMFVLESEEHALARGAHIHGEIIGYGMSGDAYHVTAPNPEGLGASLAMRNAIEDAELKPEQIDYINAHGTSTQLNDKGETLAIKKVFGDAAKTVTISSTKSMTGHMLGAAGAVEFIAATLAVEEGHIPPTINYSEPDPDCDLNYTPNKGQQKTVNVAMSNSFGFGGHNAVLIVRKWTNTGKS
jgi:3-oxoacyl-[acyl-carrier-protein] synthase II